MQQQEAVAARRGSITLVQLRDAGPGGGQQLIVPVYVLAWRVAPIGQQGEMKFALGARQIVDLEPADLLLDVLERGQQRRHGDEGAQVRGDSATQLERRQQGGAETSGDDVVDKRNGQVDRRDDPRIAEQQQPSPRHTAQRGDRQRDGQQAGCDERPGADIAADPQRAIDASRPSSRRWPETDRCFETGRPPAIK